MRFQYSLLFFFFIVTSQLGYAQAQFTATADASEIVEGGVVDIEFALKNAEGGSFTPPSFNGFKVVSGPNQSSQMSIVNGRMTRSMSISYSLIGAKQGTFTIGPAAIQVGGKVLKSKPIKIKIMKGADLPKGADGNPVDEIYVQLELSDSTVYIGQQVTAKYMLYTTKDVSSADFLTEPDLDGFYTKRLVYSNEKAERTVIDGVQFTKKAIRTIAMFPQQSGSYTIEPTYINLGIPIKGGRRRSSFFFNTRVKAMKVSTDPVKITVKNTPSGAPSSFSGAIGQYNMTAQIDKRSVSTDDALTITMKITGIGDGKFIEAPILTHKEFDFYDPNVIQDETKEQRDKIYVQKVFEYLVVPKRKGRFSIRPEFSYFNTDSSDYVTLYANQYPITVVQGSGAARELDIDKDGLSEVQAFISDVSLKKRSKSFFGSPAHLALFSLPFFSILGLVFYKRKKDIEDNIDPLLKKQTAAQKVAMRRLEKANAAMTAGQEKLFYEEINAGLFGYASDKYLIENADLTTEKVKQVFSASQVSESLQNDYADLINQCQIALYAGASGTDMNSVYEKAVDILASLESTS